MVSQNKSLLQTQILVSVKLFTDMWEKKAVGECGLLAGGYKYMINMKIKQVGIYNKYFFKT